RKAVTLHPHGLLAAVFRKLVARHRVVEGQLQRVRRRKLNDRLRIDALATDVGERVADIVRNAVELTVLGSILDDGIRRDRSTRLIDCGIIVPSLDVPVVDRRLHRAAVTLRVARVQADAPGLVVVRVAEDTRNFRRNVVEAAGRIVDGLRAEFDEESFGVVERTRRLDVHGGTDAARCDVGATRLVHFDAVDGFRSQVREVERARSRTGTGRDHVAVGIAIAAGHLTPVQRDHVELRTEAASGHERAFAVATVDRDTGNTLQGFGQVRVRELTDVFRGDRVYDAHRVALDFHRLLQASPQTGDDDLLQLLGRLLLRKRGVDKDRATDD